MTVRPGDDWGAAAASPADAVVVTGDAELAAQLAASERRAVLLRGGDLHRTVGAPRGTSGSRRLPIDQIRVDVDGTTHLAVAHVVARRPGRGGWWRGPLVAVMNAEYLGRWDVAPRSHPNDGKLDIVTVEATMGVRQRWQAWRRLPTGAHLPHPSVTVTRRSDATFRFDDALAVFVDGVERGRTRSLVVSVVPDAASIYV
jgi:hypothetical protein